MVRIETRARVVGSSCQKPALYTSFVSTNIRLDLHTLVEVQPADMDEAARECWDG